MKYLFIGGPADGQWREHDFQKSGFEVRVHHYEKPAFDPARVLLSEHAYYPHRFQENGVDYIVFSTDEAYREGLFLRLLNNYRPVS